VCVCVCVCCVLSYAVSIETWGLLTYGTGQKNGSTSCIVWVALIFFNAFKFCPKQGYFST